MRVLGRGAAATGCAFTLVVSGLIFSAAGAAHAGICSTSYLPLPDPVCTPAPTTRT